MTFGNWKKGACELRNDRTLISFSPKPDAVGRKGEERGLLVEEGQKAEKGGRGSVAVAEQKNQNFHIILP